MENTHNLYDIDYIVNIYKSYYSKHPYTNVLCGDKALSPHVLKVFNDVYDTENALRYIYDNCIKHNINTSNDYHKLVFNHVRSKLHILRSNAFDNNIPYSKSKLIELYDVKQNLDMYKTNDHTYLSIDIKHAFSQYVDSLNIFGTKFDNLILSGLPEFMQKSKSIRLFMYSQIHAHETLRYNIPTLFDSIFDSNDKLIELLKLKNSKLVTYNWDELIFDITDDNDFDEFLGDRTIAGINLTISKFVPHMIVYIDPLIDEQRSLHIREYTTGTYYVEKRCKYITQLHKVYKGLPIEELDMYYMNDDNLCKLNEPIKIIEII